jgi:MFS family permease
MVIAGIGLGAMMQVFVLAVQNSVRVRAMGSATALTQFSRSIGATLGVTLMGVIVNQGLPPAARNEQVAHRLAPLARVELADALHPAFLASACLCVVVFLLVVFGIREVPLRKGFEEPSLADELGQRDPSPGTVGD